MRPIVAALGVVFALGIGPAAAEKDSLKESFKKTEKGAGELLRGMGQELQKIGGSLASGTKKDGKKKEARKAQEGAK